MNAADPFKAEFVVRERLYCHSLGTHSITWNPDGSVTETRTEEHFDPPIIIEPTT